MKKSIFAIVAGLVCLMMVACSSKGKDIDVDPQTLDDKVEQCWEIVYSYGGQSASTYMWGTERECVIALQEAQKRVGVGKYTYKSSSAKDAQACWELDEKSNK